jgi:hypothetical protein
MHVRVISREIVPSSKSIFEFSFLSHVVRYTLLGNKLEIERAKRSKGNLSQVASLDRMFDQPVADASLAKARSAAYKFPHKVHCTMYNTHTQAYRCDAVSFR